MQAVTIDQFALDLSTGAGVARDDLVRSPANAAAVQAIDDWPGWPMAVLVIAGPVGSGKTHLARIWQDRANATLLRAHDLAGAAIEATRRGPVLIDGVDDGAIDEAGLFHVLNVVREAGTSMLMTARRFPAAWPVQLPDLASRLRAVSLVELGEPDDALLEAVIMKLFADRQVSVDPNVARYVALRIERSLATAIDVVRRIDALALARHARISRALAAEIIRDNDRGEPELPLD
jgi:chromosomal replication initiation ATPase DnaA